eukprot:GHVL01003894.1.p1 GENE.GHVL01003894.1~~GHVL01003894.1.p1  ORF type:complete len:273 (-),score=54.20 GHVL01003894.1:38-856(-)
MVLHFIGLGLGDVKDVTVKGLEIIKKCNSVYLETYTAILCNSTITDLELFYGRKIIEADRHLVEKDAESIIKKAISEDVAFLVAGDPLCATTHTDLIIRAKMNNVKVEVTHNASIMTAVAVCGLQLYRFGETISIPFWQDNWKPDSFYDKIYKNSQHGLHSLCLLDIKMKEQTLENLMKEKEIYEPPRFMTLEDALQQLFEIEKNRNLGICASSARGFGLSNIGSSTNQIIISGTLEELSKKWKLLGPPLHSLVICADLHEMENEFFVEHSI